MFGIRVIRAQAWLAAAAAFALVVVGLQSASAAITRPTAIALDSTWRNGGTGLSSAPDGLVAEADGSVIAWYTNNPPAFNGLGWWSDTDTLDASVTDYPDGNGDYSPGRLIRIRPDGSYDVRFSSMDGFLPNDVAVEADGKLLVATGGGAELLSQYMWDGASVGPRDFRSTGGLIRIDSRGVSDATFRPDGTGFNQSVNLVEVAPDGRIYVMGGFTSFTGATWDGSTLNSNTATTTSISKLARLLPDGTLDLTFESNGGFNNTVNDFKVLSDGSLIVGGAFTSVTARVWDGSALAGTVTSTAVKGIAKIRPDGSVDTTFGGGTGFDTAAVNTLGVTTDGMIYVGGGFATYNGKTLTGVTVSGSATTTKMAGIVRLTSNGVFDLGFRSATTTLTTGNAGSSAVQRLAVDQDGGVWITGTALGSFTGKTDSNGTLAGGTTAVTRTVLQRITPAGALDIAALPASGSTTSGKPRLASGPNPRVFLSDISTYKGNTWNGSAVTLNTSATSLPKVSMVWGAQTIPVVYSPNGGTGAMTWTSAVSGSSTITLAQGRFSNGSGVFTGWNTQPDGTGTPYAAGDSFTSPTDPTVLYAQWTGGNAGPSSSTFGTITSVLPAPAPSPSSYSVSYDSAGGSTINTSTSVTMFTPGVSFNLPAAPTRGGYSFAGWNYSSGSPSSTAAGDAAVTSSATANLTLTAQWTARSDNSISYSLNSGTAGTGAGDASYTTASSFTLPGAPTRAGYTFNGWQISGTFATQATTPANATNATVTGYGAVTLTAQWTGVTSNTVTYDLNSGTTGIGAGASTFTTGSSFTLPGAPTRSGYDFVGWAISGSNATSATTAATDTSATVTGYGNVTLTAQWAVQSFLITVDAASGTGATGGSANFTPGTSFTLPSTPLRGGYTFGGWRSTGTGISTTTTTPGATSLTLSGTGAITLTALWTADSNNAVSYALAGGSAGSGTGASSYTTGQPFTLPGAPSRGGYTFAGWQLTGTHVTTSTEAANASTASVNGYGATTVSALWTANSGSANTISTALNSGTAGANAGDANYTTDSSFTLPSAPSRAGYTFAGWQITGPTATTSTTAANATTATVAGYGLVTLTAQWTGESSAITYAYGSGTASVSTGASSYSTGSTFTLPGNPSRPGYTFTGWQLAGSNATSASIAANATSASVTGYGAVTLTAQWTLGSYPVAYVASGFTPSGASTSYSTGGTITLPTNQPTLGGYTFAGWVLSGTSVSNATLSTTDTTVTPNGYGDVAITALWTALSHSVTVDLAGGTAGANAGGASYLTGSNLSLPSAPTRSGYTFAGWSLSGPNLTTTTTNAFATATVPSGFGAVTVQALWTAVAAPTLSSPSVTSSAAGQTSGWLIEQLASNTDGSLNSATSTSAPQASASTQSSQSNSAAQAAQSTQVAGDTTSPDLGGFLMAFAAILTLLLAGGAWLLFRNR